jgi:hypothetical protein
MADALLPPAADVVFRRLGSGGVLVDLRTDRLFDLNDTGATVWEGLAAGLPFDDIVASLTAAFDVAPATAEREARALIESLTAAGLLNR